MGWLLGWNSPVHSEGLFPRQDEPWLGLCPGDAAGAWASLLALLWAFSPCTVPLSLGLIIAELSPTSCMVPAALWFGKALVSAAQEASKTQVPSPLGPLLL